MTNAYVSHGSTGLQLNASALAWEAKILAAAQEAQLDTSYIVQPLARAFSTVLDALGGLSQAQAQIAPVSARPELTRAQKIAQASAIASRARDAATSAVDGLDSVRQRIADELNAALRVKRPAGLDSATLVDKKADLLAVIEQRGKKVPEKLSQAACDLLAAALDTGDDVRAYILANELDDQLEAHGVLPSAWAYERAQCIGSRKGDGTPVPGSAVWHALAEGGEGTLAGYLAYVRACVQRLADSLDAFVSSSSLYWQDGVGGGR